MKLVIAISTKKDGNMKLTPEDGSSVYNSRNIFLKNNDINPSDTTLLKLDYSKKNFCNYLSIDNHSKGDGIIREHVLSADALVVTKPNHALFLPLADCIGAVIFDQKANVMMLSHLGRHNLCDNGGKKSIDYLCKKHGLDANNLTIELSPSAGKENYPLFDFNNRSLVDVAIEQMTLAGVNPKKIKISPIDTTTDKNYFSHSQFLAGKRANDYRFAIVAMMTED